MSAIWWIRRDLRLSDNAALHAALQSAEQIIPLFIVDPNLIRSTQQAHKRLAFLWDGLRALDHDLQQRGSRLIVRYGEPPAVLQQMMDEVSAESIHAEADITPYAKRRDAAIAKTLPLKLAHGLTARPTDQITKKDGTPYTVFTPFKKTWLAHSSGLPHRRDLFAAPAAITTPQTISSEQIPDNPALPHPPLFKAGETEAQQRLKAFFGDRMYAYNDKRNRMDLDGTSTLSPYLRFGMLSAREAIVTALEAIAQSKTAEQRTGSETWLSELIWREFYQVILDRFPRVRGGNFRPKYNDIPWRNNQEDFAAWCEGRTGYPTVDAAMRQLNTTGWMHNRARMIVASFLTKDLLIDWRWGERYFMSQLIDGDLAANNGGWQWTAGTGTDAAPYFRIFNPISQGEKFDPHGAYVRQWVPELTKVPDKYIQKPWEWPTMYQQLEGVVIGRDYPQPIVDHKWARVQTLAAYKVSTEKNA